MVRAKELLKSDRKAAAEEAKRIKELQAQHNRLKEVCRLTSHSAVYHST